ncbi:Aste57867_17404 [Aphanomyces stellatus]|uniref:Aste57867_17404 protein n=1 Tax=Aphanomyces stellatus TaxID=120398 RepID=A0A485LBA2_9STRA|nr:hypothetical protein As57867_017344 [Aphanomyces stellatus]VFT94160.1 Aste57867_17404 [Aphanomyces stellatus]
MACAAATATCRNRDILRVIFDFQRGIPKELVDLAPFHLLHAHSWLLADLLTVDAHVARFHAAFDPWLTQHDAHAPAALARLCQFWPSMVATILVHAAVTGNVPILRLLLATHKDAAGDVPRLASDLAARHGHLDGLRVLLAAGQTCTARAIDLASDAGHLHVVEFLHAADMGASTDAMDRAAANGHLDVVRFLHLHRAEGCTTAAMNSAARHGHMDVVRFLHHHRHEGGTSLALDWAAKYGHLEMVKFLHAHRYEGCTTKAMDGAIVQGHVEVVQFLHDHRTEGCTANALDRLVRDHLFYYLHLPMTQFLLAHGYKLKLV